MEDGLTVEILPPTSRGMTMKLSSGVQQFDQDFTTSVFPFLEQLCDAVRVLHDGFVDEKIRLLIGAPECDLRLYADVGSSQATLQIDLWPDHKRSVLVHPQIVFRFEGSREAIAAAFINAFKKLRSNVNDIDFEREYGAPFPSAAYSKLMRRAE